MQRSLTRAFVAGSAYPVALVPFLYFAGLTLLQRDFGMTWLVTVTEQDRETVAMLLFALLPVVTGVWNALFIAVYDLLPGSTPDHRHWLSGFLLGLALPVVGNLVSAPELFLAVPFPGGIMAVPLIMVACGIVWRYLVQPINTAMALVPETEDENWPGREI